MEVAEVKQRVRAEVDRRAALLIEISHELHDHPELAYEEHRAHDLLSSALADEGLEVERHAYGLETAFMARAGASGPTIAVLCEYDALPDIGHACGHNVIGAAGLGAGLAAATLATELGARVVVLGSPAEEGGGGKIAMARRGAFDGIDAAMMVHPAGADLLHMDTVAIQQLRVDYEGQAAHAAAFPWLGRNALDAAVLGYMNVAALRQHIRPNERIHGIFTEAGERPNIVPQHAGAFWYVRSPTMTTLQPLKDRVLACLEAGAQASGCAMHHEWDDHPYFDMIDNAPMVAAYVDNMAVLGRTVRDPRELGGVVGSTDMGNVSYLVPSIHPMIQVAPAGVSIHSPEFTVHARSEAGDRAVLDGAKALAMTIVDLWSDAGLLTAAGVAHRAEIERRS